MMAMRFVVVGAGAVGGVIASCLHQSGEAVALIARGEHLKAIQRNGLLFETPDTATVLRIPAFPDPAAVEWAEDDVVILAVKSQDTATAVAEIAASARPSTVVVCAQNGVANERRVLRYFRSVLGVCVVLPANHLSPGVVGVASRGILGVLDVGRYPSGVHPTAHHLADVLRSASFDSLPQPEIMRWKYAKLLENLGNAVDAICGRHALHGELVGIIRREGESCLEAAGIQRISPDEYRSRCHHLIGRATITGSPRLGSSSWQSLARGSGTIETDYLNGEIILLGRLNGVPTPANELVQRTANRMARERIQPGTTSESSLLAELDGISA